MLAEINLYKNLQDRVISGEFRPGERLKSDVIRKDYSVSASSVREVLFRLSTVGLVNFFEQRGFRVPEQSDELLNDLTKMRILLESEGACLSIRHGGVSWRAKLNAAHHELKFIETQLNTDERPPEVLALWVAAELKFHRTLIEECQSPTLIEYHLQTYQRARQQLMNQDTGFTRIPQNIDQHQEILDAVLGGDESLVRKKIAGHLSRHLIAPDI